MFSLRMALIPAALAGLTLLGISSAGAVAKLGNAQPAVSVDKAAPSTNTSGKVLLVGHGRSGGYGMGGGYSSGHVIHGGGTSQMHMRFQRSPSIHHAPLVRRFDGGNWQRYNVRSKHRYYKPYKRFSYKHYRGHRRYRGHRHYRGWWGPVIIGPDYYYDDYYYNDYYDCYRSCRRHHGPRYCRRHWRRYCYY
jgi:hypothetical protein